MSVRMLIQGSAFSPYSGYGKDLIGLTQALMRAGVDVYLQPSHVSAPLPPEIARLLEKKLEAPFDIILQQSDPFQLEMTATHKMSSDIKVCWTMWEFLGLHNLDSTHTRIPDLPEQWQNIDLMLVYDQVTKQALDPVCSQVSDITVDVLQGGFDPGEWSKANRDWYGDRLGLIMIGELNLRKAPFSVISAFRDLKRAYPNDFKGLTLSLKSGKNTGLHPAMAEWATDTRIWIETWDQSKIQQFYAANHVLMAPSWGEGKHLPALEFMTTGGVVAHTDFGGMAMWGNDEYTYPLRDYKLEAHDPEFPEAKSARVSSKELQDVMAHMYHNRDEIKHKGDVASRVIPQLMNWDTKVDQFFKKVQENLPGKGDELFYKYLAGRQQFVEYQ